jgi:hypothetical protein
MMKRSSGVSNAGRQSDRANSSVGSALVLTDCFRPGRWACTARPSADLGTSCAICVQDSIAINLQGQPMQGSRWSDGRRTGQRRRVLSVLSVLYLSVCMFSSSSSPARPPPGLPLRENCGRAVGGSRPASMYRPSCADQLICERSRRAPWRSPK